MTKKNDVPKISAGRDQLGEFAPQFAALNDDVLFQEVWTNGDLNLRDRSFVTVSALVAQGLTDESLRFHLNAAKAHDITGEEIAAALTHLAFYVGWPKVWPALTMAKEVWS
ncbi:MAG: carboxymuconolactone decarboxylase family protein [Corynebacterium sp.]|nr:carboxymuconolactone decarboxylase family protein [Corynebacterium sp.]